jgi:hypothetical protein
LLPTTRIYSFTNLEAGNQNVGSINSFEDQEKEYSLSLS